LEISEPSQSEEEEHQNIREMGSDNSISKMSEHLSKDSISQSKKVQIRSIGKKKYFIEVSDDSEK
jgi:hypothetical protein